MSDDNCQNWEKNQLANYDKVQIFMATECNNNKRKVHVSQDNTAKK